MEVTHFIVLRLYWQNKTHIFEHWKIIKQSLLLNFFMNISTVDICHQVSVSFMIVVSLTATWWGNWQMILVSRCAVLEVVDHGQTDKQNLQWNWSNKKSECFVWKEMIVTNFLSNQIYDYFFWPLKDNSIRVCIILHNPTKTNFIKHECTFKHFKCTLCCGF